MSGLGGGNFYYGKDGFLFKQKPAGGGRKSTKFFPGGGSTTNVKTSLFNKFQGGNTGIGGQSTSVRRAKNIRATVCSDNNCHTFFNELGKDNNYTGNLGMNNTLSRSIYTIFPNKQVDTSLYSM
jgi:hypothetical protein